MHVERIVTAAATLEIKGRTAEVRLNRPAKHNAVNLQMFGDLAAIGDEIASNRSIRAVVLGAEGPNFCAGIDTALFGAGTGDLAGLLQPVDGSPANLFQRAAYVWREVPVPVICAIEGVAFGAGLQIALGADLRYATPAAQLSIMEIKWGLIPDMALTVLGRDLAASDRLRELALTGRVISAAEAEQLGLLTGLCEDPTQRARDIAESIADRSPDAVRAIKRLFDEAFHLPPADALAMEARLQAGLIGEPNQVEAVKANLHQRQARFDD
jgi:enoyl-CoA hydratase/carnithine racemase